ncbi:c-type cytochrome [Palleronia sp.]|uniref:c-type cytochrome n=1 Tax=Palleronia sp. TaxID=1940284 RepID=UPI0035C807C7
MQDHDERKFTKTKALSFEALALAAAPAFAQDTEASGDPAAGEKVLNQCQACHVIRNDAEETLAGRTDRTGANLYDLEGRQGGTVDDYRYSTAMVEAGEAGLEWSEEDFVTYVQDPTGFLRKFLDDASARGKMLFKLRSDEDAAKCLGLHHVAGRCVRLSRLLRMGRPRGGGRSLALRHNRGRARLR